MSEDNVNNNDNIGPLIWKSSPNVYNSLKQSGASNGTMRRSAAAIHLQNQHKTFIGMPDAEARIAFSKLPETERKALIDFFPEAKYSAPKPSTWQKLKSVGFIPSFGQLMNAFDVYANTQTNLYRQVNLKQEQLRTSPEEQERFAGVQERVAATPLVPGAGMFPAGIQVVPPTKKDTSKSFQAFLDSNQWNTTFKGEQYFDKEKLKVVESKWSPAVAKVAKLYAMGKTPDEIMLLLDTPAEEAAYALYNDPTNGKKSEVYKALNDFDHAKVSPGRDLAYPIRSLDKQSKVPDLYDITSGLTDAAFIIATDIPGTVLGFGVKTLQVARYGLLKLAGANGIKLSDGLDKMFKYAPVRRFWDNAGKKVAEYADATDLTKRGQIAGDLARDFGIDVSKKVAVETGEIGAIDFIQQLSKAGVRDADSALKYFKNAGITELINLGRAGGVDTLMPRRSIVGQTAINLRSTVAGLVGLKKAPSLPAVWDDAEELSKNFENIGDLKRYRSAVGNFTRIMGKAVSGKDIVLETAESAVDIFRLARLIVDPYHANIIKQAWREGNEGTRLKLFDGIAINIGKKFGLSDEKVKELYSRTGTQLYAEDMTILSRGATALGQIGNLGRRTGLTEQTLASTAAVTKGALADLSQQLKDASDNRKVVAKKVKDLKDKGVVGPELEAAQRELDTIGKKIGGIIKQRNYYKNVTGQNVTNVIRQAMIKSGIPKDDVKVYMQILQKGVVDGEDPYQFQQILGTVYDVIGNDNKLVKQFTRNIDGLDVVDWDMVNDFVVKGFPTVEEVAAKIGQATYNPAQLGDSQYGLGYWHLSRTVTLPNFAEWSRKSNSQIVGSARYLGEYLTTGWSWATLIPRLGIRSAIEELGLFGIAVPLGSLHQAIIGKVISTEYRYAKYGEQQLGLVNRMMVRLFRDSGRRITPAQRELLKQNPELLPKLVAKNVAASKAVIALSGFDTTTVERWVKDYVDSPYGMAALDDINEGVLASLNLGERSADQAAIKAQKLYGPIVKWNYRAKEAADNLRATGEFDNIRTNDYGFDVNWLTSIQLRVDHKTNLGWGKTVLAHIYNEEKAVQALMKQYEKTPEIMERFVLYKTLGPEEFARRQFKLISHPFIKSNGLLNEKLINKVRKTIIDPNTGQRKLEIDASKLTLRDLDEFDRFERPESVLGIKYIPAPTGAAGIWDAAKRGPQVVMNWMGRQISILGREPAFNANYLLYRKKLIQAENDIVARHIENGLDKTTAEAIASKWASNVSLDLSMTRTLQYVDNPAVRTNMAFSVRNFARYYRATEDFGRRVGRVFRYDPLALAKFRLGANALDHSGFIHQDEDGELYFVYPGDEIIYSAVGLGLRLLGYENALRQPMPAQFTAKVSMLTPGLDPESGIPTLSGPVSAFGIWVIENWLPDSKQQQFRKAILGKYSVSKTLPELLLPTTVARIMNMFNSDERTSQYASAHRKAISLYAANGVMRKFISQALKGGAEKDAAQQKFLSFVDATARNIVVARNLLGLIAPSSPQLDFGTDVPDWVREQTNITNLKPQFQKFVQQYGNDPEATDKALAKWTRIYPGKSIYALTESEMDGIGTIKPAKEAIQWIKENDSLFKKYPKATRFIVPTNGQYDLEAYAFLQDQGYREMKPIEQFAEEAFADEGYFYWRLVKTDTDKKIANTTDPVEKRLLQNKWTAWSDMYKSRYTGLQSYIESFPAKTDLRRQAIAQIYNMYSNGDMPSTESNKKLIRMVRVYNAYQSQINLINGRTEVESNARNVLIDETNNSLLEIAGGDDQALAAYRTLFSPLIGE